MRARIIICKLVLVAIFVLVTGCTETEAQKVFITRTGEKYHRKSCGYLKYSSIELELREAKKNGYTPCSVCKPPSKEQAPGTNSQTPATSQEGVPLYEESKPPKATSTQCTAITQAGSRCKRTTSNANGKCWQHQGKD